MGSIEQILEIGWSPHIGDPTFLGWMTTAGYLLAALLSLLCAGRVLNASSGRSGYLQSVPWLMLGSCLAVLGINKQLDLQTWAIAAARVIAVEQDWYAKRQIVQAWLVVGAIGVAVIIFIGSALIFRTQWRQALFLLFGLLFILRFLIVRMASIFGVALPRLSRFSGGITINWMLELVGVALVLVAILYQLLFQRQQMVGED